MYAPLSRYVVRPARLAPSGPHALWRSGATGGGISSKALAPPVWIMRPCSGHCWSATCRCKFWQRKQALRYGSPTGIAASRIPSFGDAVACMLDALEISLPVGLMVPEAPRRRFTLLYLAYNYFRARPVAQCSCSARCPTSWALLACYRHLSPVWKALLWGQTGFPGLNRGTAILRLSRHVGPPPHPHNRCSRSVA